MVAVHARSPITPTTKSLRCARITDNSKNLQKYLYQGGKSLADVGTKGANITAINAIYEGGGVPSSYTIANGDTLYSIAQAIYGDSAKWYLIADANGLTQNPSTVFSNTDIGRSLRIPNVSTSLHNNAATFKPYNPGEIIGDLAPTPVFMPPLKTRKQGHPLI